MKKIMLILMVVIVFSAVFCGNSFAEKYLEHAVIVNISENDSSAIFMLDNGRTYTAYYEKNPHFGNIITLFYVGLQVRIENPPSFAGFSLPWWDKDIWIRPNKPTPHDDNSIISYGQPGLKVSRIK